MEAIWIILQRYVQGMRPGEVALRAAIIALYIGVISYIVRIWPGISQIDTAQIKNVVYPLLVYAVFIWMMFTLFGPILLSVTGMKGAARRFGGFMVGGVFYLTRVTIMTLVNTLILAIRVGVAAITPGNLLQTCTDAITHYIERQTDMIVWQLRR